MCGSSRSVKCIVRTSVHSGHYNECHRLASIGPQIRGQHGGIQVRTRPGAADDLLTVSSHGGKQRGSQLFRECPREGTHPIQEGLTLMTSSPPCTLTLGSRVSQHMNWGGVQIPSPSSIHNVLFKTGVILESRKAECPPSEEDKGDPRDTGVAAGRLGSRAIRASEHMDSLCLTQLGPASARLALA